MKKIVSIILSSAMLVSVCGFGVYAAESEHPDIVFGDVNIDGNISIMDVTEMQKDIADVISLDNLKAIDEGLLDFNDDKKYDISDVTALQKHLVDVEHVDNVGSIVYSWCEEIAEEIEHPAVTEPVKVYDREISLIICDDCDSDLTDLSELELKMHLNDHSVNGGKGTYRNEIKIEQVEIKANEATYQSQLKLFCDDCDADLTDATDEELQNHINEHVQNGEIGTVSKKWVYVQISYWTEKVVEEAWTETVIVSKPGYYPCNS